jgi:gamma-F420-2:alpha-L-glutamate ligase
VSVINTSSTIEAVNDKRDAHPILTQRNLQIPRTMLVRFPVDPQLLATSIGFPCVVKLLMGEKTCGCGW